MSSTGSRDVSPSCSPPNPNHAPKFGTLIPNRIFVGGIAANTTESELHALFSKYGVVKATKIIADRAGVSKGYGFVTFESEMEVKKIQEEADDIILKERKLNIAPAIKKQPCARIYDAPSPPPLCNPVCYHNGIPYMYHNGTAFFTATIDPNGCPGMTGIPQQLNTGQIQMVYPQQYYVPPQTYTAQAPANTVPAQPMQSSQWARWQNAQVNGNYNAPVLPGPGSEMTQYVHSMIPQYNYQYQMQSYVPVPHQPLPCNQTSTSTAMTTGSVQPIPSHTNGQYHGINQQIPYATQVASTCSKPQNIIHPYQQLGSIPDVYNSFAQLPDYSSAIPVSVAAYTHVSSTNNVGNQETKSNEANVNSEKMTTPTRSDQNKSPSKNHRSNDGSHYSRPRMVARTVNGIPIMTLPMSASGGYTSPPSNSNRTDPLTPPPTPKIDVSR